VNSWEDFGRRLSSNYSLSNKEFGKRPIVRVDKDQTPAPTLRILRATFSVMKMKFYQDGENILKII